MPTQTQSYPATSIIPFGTRQIGEGHPVLIIAEIGINHEGDPEQCKRLISAASASGADAIKLQTSDPDENYVPSSESHKLFARGQLSPEETASAFDQARALGLEAFTTTGLGTFEWVDRLKPAAHKISSSLLFHYPLIRRAARSKRSLLMSTGMAEIGDTDEAVTWARECGAAHIGLFQCTSLYPAPLETLDLAAVTFFKERYDMPVGFSDHSLGIQASIAATAAGAAMIEKHFTLDCSRSSFDHHISLDPDQFKKMVKGIRDTETMLGYEGKRMVPAAAEVARRMRRYLVAAVNLEPGQRLTSQDIAVMRLGDGNTGLHPKHFDNLVGVEVTAPLPRYAPFSFKGLKFPH